MIVSCLILTCYGFVYNNLYLFFLDPDDPTIQEDLNTVGCVWMSMPTWPNDLSPACQKNADLVRKPVTSPCVIALW
jgi:hypothetical protein